MDHKTYYRDLDIPFLDADICNRLKSLASKTVEEHSYQDYEWTHFDHLHFKSLDQALPELYQWTSGCAVRANPVIYLLPPNIIMPVHTDSNYAHVRQSTIAMPLLPDQDVADTHWYEDLGSTHPIATAKWKPFGPKLLNIGLPHGGIKTGAEWRCSFQISLAAPYHQICDLIENGLLFGNHACGFTD